MTYSGYPRSLSGGVFGRFVLRERLQMQLESMKATIEKFGEDKILNQSVSDLVEQFVEHFDLDPPVIHWSEATQLEPEEITLEVSNDPLVHAFDGRTTRKVHGTRVTVIVPVSGETELLGANPSTSLLRPWDNIQLRGGELAIWKDWAKPIESQIQQWWSAEKTAIERQIGHIGSELETWKAKFPEAVSSQIELRRERLLRNRGLEGTLGIPVRRRGEHPNPIPVERKKVATTRALKISPTNARQSEPFLEDQIYFEIIDIVCSLGRGWERTPRVARKYDEEELRDQILIHLNGHFEGEAGGELFNGAGMSDILVRHGDRNVFIAECKIWSGQAGLIAAIDQLGKYMVWRDTKAALVLFIRQKDPSAIIDKANVAIREHQAFRRDGRPSSQAESYSNFIMRHGDDDQRDIQLALIPIVIRSVN